LVECQLPKLNVAGSNPVSRSISPSFVLARLAIGASSSCRIAPTACHNTPGSPLPQPSSARPNRPDLDQTSCLQRFTPRRRTGTNSDCNRTLAQRLLAEGRMTKSGLKALGMDHEADPYREDR
jgi:hypothetical protein